jgi:hypothetical protein
MVMVITPCLLLQNAAGQVEHPVQFWIGRTLKSGSIFGRHQHLVDYSQAEPVALTQFINVVPASQDPPSNDTAPG